MVRLAVIGDTHLTRDEFFPSPAREVGQAHDRAKYVANVDRTVRPMLADIRRAAPDLLLHSGDLVEGAPGEAGWEEMRWALDLVREAVDCPVLLARGNHDRRECFAEVVTRHNIAVAGERAATIPFAWEQDGLRVVVTDTSDGSAPAQAGLRQLLEPGGWSFVLGHSPAFNVGRPFFRDRPFDQVLLGLARDLPVHALFCGHTHNTSVVGYDAGGRVLSQVMLSSIRWGDGPGVPLAAAKTWLVPPARQRYAWPGLLENSPPVWACVEVGDDQVAVELRRVGGALELAFTIARDGTVSEHHRATPPPAGELSSGIRRAWLCLSLYRAPRRSCRVMLGDLVLGQFPTTVPHYHHRTEIPPAALPHIGPINPVRLAGEADERLVVGSLAIEAELADGGRRFTRPSAILAVGDAYTDWPEPEVILAPAIAQLPTVRLSFDSG